MKKFLKCTFFCFIAILISLPFGCNSSKKPKTSQFSPRLGVCTSVTNQKKLAAAGFDYLEESVQRFLVPDKKDEDFKKNLKNYDSNSLPVYACNSFLPGTLKCIGPNADHEKVLAFAKTAFERAEKVGIISIVFGSSSSRSIPEGFEREQAQLQFVSLLKKMGPLAREHNVVVCIEPLNRTECNFINTLAEGTRIAQQVNDENIRLLADFYHMMREDEPPQAIINADKLLYHCHIAERENRTPPGAAGDDFKPYLNALKQIGYEGGISIECRWSNFNKQLDLAREYLQKQINEANKQ